jgi:hypothetical protein
MQAQDVLAIHALVIRALAAVPWFLSRKRLLTHTQERALAIRVLVILVLAKYNHTMFLEMR